MKVLNIHGYKGSAKNSAYEVLTALGHEVTSPDLDYDAILPDETVEILLKKAGECGAEMIVGSSLGGFYAAVLSVRLGIPITLINPCLLPFLHLPRLGYTGDIRQFMPLFGELAKIDDCKVYAIIGEKDEVIDTHDMTRNLLKNSRIVLVPNGMHSGSTLPLYDLFAH